MHGLTPGNGQALGFHPGELVTGLEGESDPFGLGEVGQGEVADRGVGAGQEAHEGAGSGVDPQELDLEGAKPVSRGEAAEVAAEGADGAGDVVSPAHHGGERVAAKLGKAPVEGVAGSVVAGVEPAQAEICGACAVTG